VLDHCTLVVKVRNVDWGPKPFRTFDAWAEVVGFKEVVRRAWGHRLDGGNYIGNVKMKLKELKQQLKAWRDQVFK